MDPRPVSPGDDDEPIRALEVLRTGVRRTPELKAGFVASLSFGLVIAAGRLVVPIAIQQILDKGVSSGTPDWNFVVVACAVAAAAIIGLAVLNRITYLRLMTTAENVLYGLRTRAFGHVHALSLSHHNESQRGVLVARVTSDIETLAQFASWGAVSWVVNSTMIVVALGVLALYSWQLALVVFLVLIPVLPIMKSVQKRQLRAYDDLRTKVGDTLSEISEVVGGIRVIRAYGNVPEARRRLQERIQKQYKSQLVARLFFAIMFPVSDVFSGLALAAVVGVGVWWGPGWGLEAGTLVACLFLTNLIVQPVAELGEILDQTQTALAGWRKVLNLLDEPVEVVEAAPGVTLARGALDVSVQSVEFEYEAGHPVLHGVSLDLPAGINAAIVGETGSGKTTMAKLLSRLADPTAGRVVVGGVDLREVAKDSRALSVRLVPQDGFLFDTTIAENVRFGRTDATDEEIRDAFRALDLDWWVDGLHRRPGHPGARAGRGPVGGGAPAGGAGPGAAGGPRPAHPGRGHLRGGPGDGAGPGRGAGQAGPRPDHRQHRPPPVHRGGGGRGGGDGRRSHRADGPARGTGRPRWGVRAALRVLDRQHPRRLTAVPA